MTENTQTIDDSAEPGEVAEQPAENTSSASESQDVQEKEPRNAEAKRYRLRLRETEAERDGLRTSLDQARQQILDRDLDPAFRNLVKLAGLDIAPFFAEDGTLNEEALEQAAQELHEEYPNMLDVQKGEWQKLDEPQKLQIFRKHGTGAAAPRDIDEGRSPSTPLGNNKWQDAFTPNK